MDEQKDTYVRGLAKGIVNVLAGGLPVLDEQLRRAGEREEPRQDAVGRDDADGADNTRR